MKKIELLLEKYKKLLQQLYELDKSHPAISRAKTFITNELKRYQDELITETTLQRILHHFTNNEFGIVSAFKSQYTWEENLEHHYQLSQDIKSLGYGYLPIVGKWKKVPEHSIFIPKIRKEEIVELAKKYDQDYCIWGEHGKWHLINVRTSEIEDTGERFRVLDIDKEFDNYSALKFIIDKKPDIENLSSKDEERKEYISEILSNLKDGDIVYLDIKPIGFTALVFPSGHLYLYKNKHFYKLPGDKVDDLLDENRQTAFLKKLFQEQRPYKFNSDLLERIFVLDHEWDIILKIDNWNSFCNIILLGDFVADHSFPSITQFKEVLYT